MARKMVAMKDIATACGVSVATVSKALNDQNDIGKETKEHIRSVAEKMGYFPNSAAKALKTNITKNIGLYVEPELSWTIPSESRVLETWRSEYPFMFSVATGLRINLGRK